MNRHGVQGGEPLMDRGYPSWFLARLAVNCAAGMVAFAVILCLVLSRPFAGEYADVFYALRDLARYLRPFIAVSVLACVLLASG